MRQSPAIWVRSTRVVKFAYYTKEPEILKVKQFLVDELLRVQENDGYIGMLKKDSRMSSYWDIHEMSYVIYGLVNDYRYFNNKKSLDAAISAANYIIRNWNYRQEENWHMSNHLTIIGLDRALLVLYRETENPSYLNFLIDELHMLDWDFDIVLGRKEKLEGHIYAYMARALAQLELYSIQQDDRLLRTAERAVKFLTEEDGMVITGGAGQYEIWTNDQDGGHGLAETCATAYQIRIYE